MPFLVILKRFEIWLLAVVVFALIWFASQTEPTSVVASPAVNALTVVESGIPAETRPILQVQEVQVHTTKGGQVVDLTLSGRSPTGEDLVLNSSNVSAKTADGEVVNRFFEPFRQNIELGLVRFIAEHQAAADHTHHICADQDGIVNLFDHIAIGIAIAACFQAVRMPPGIDPVKAIAVQLRL